MAVKLTVISSKLGSLALRLNLRLQKPTGKFEDSLKAAGSVYMGFIRRRFVEQSKGGGEWPDLALSTKMGRLRRSGKGKAQFNRVKKAHLHTGQFTTAQANKAAINSLHFDILRDRGLLLNSLSQGSADYVQKKVDYGIVVGTANKTARFHQEGGPRLPQRKIIVLPDGDALGAMKQILSSGFQAVMMESAEGAHGD